MSRPFPVPIRVVSMRTDPDRAVTEAVAVYEDDLDLSDAAAVTLAARFAADERSALARFAAGDTVDGHDVLAEITAALTTGPPEPPADQALHMLGLFVTAAMRAGREDPDVSPVTAADVEAARAWADSFIDRFVIRDDEDGTTR